MIMLDRNKLKAAARFCADSKDLRLSLHGVLVEASPPRLGDRGRGNQMIAITGNTYPVKDQLKALGGRWNADRKAWMVPDDQVAAAQALVSGAPASSNADKGDRPRFRPTRCAECGARPSRYTRIYGYSNATARCGPCFGDRRDGYDD